MASPFIPTIKKRFKLPFVTRAKYERMKRERNAFRNGCDFKQETVMHYKTNYLRLANLLTRPRDEHGRFVQPDLRRAKGRLVQINKPLHHLLDGTAHTNPAQGDVS